MRNSGSSWVERSQKQSKLVKRTGAYESSTHCSSSSCTYKASSSCNLSLSLRSGRVDLEKTWHLHLSLSFKIVGNILTTEWLEDVKIHFVEYCPTTMCEIISGWEVEISVYEEPGTWICSNSIVLKKFNIHKN